jgi:hypothetical protein
MRLRQTVNATGLLALAFVCLTTLVKAPTICVVETQKPGQSFPTCVGSDPCQYGQGQPCPPSNWCGRYHYYDPVSWCNTDATGFSHCDTISDDCAEWVSCSCIGGICSISMVGTAGVLYADGWYVPPDASPCP